jgi:hypothetical protein
MARNKRSSPVLSLAITQDQYDHAVQSASGGCLIADAIKEQYPELVNVSVDMATIRVSDRKRGERYIYLAPPAAQHVLLAFDQGWPNPVDQLTIKGAVQILPITRSGHTPERRAARLRELEEREAAGTLTRQERSGLTRMRKRPSGRPSAIGPAKVTTERGKITVRGGRPIVQGPAHPNLLRGRDRHFGAKLADPGQAFRDAVEAELARRAGAVPS